MAIDEPAAILPVLKVLADDSIPNVRVLAARVLAVIPGTEASTALVGRLLGEEDEFVRQETMNELKRRDASEVAPLLAKGLRSSAHQIVNRAAWALGNLNALAAVPSLIPALITYEYQVVIVDSGPSAPTGAAGAGFASYSSRAIPILLPPVVGPGVVAYGATSVPSGPGPGQSIGGGGGGGGASGGPTPRLVQIENRNDEVRAALVKLTGRDFGYDIPVWKQWMATSFRVEPKPSRRVPEP
jgi:hypothetical protein